MTTRSRQLTITLALAGGVALGGYGIASAADGQPATPADTDETVEVDDLEEEDVDEVDPGRAAEAQLSEADAVAVATGVAPGTVGDVELEDDDGALVYEIEITDTAGTETEVTIDAVSGDVIANETDDDHDDDDVEHENEHEGEDEDDPDEDHED